MGNFDHFNRMPNQNEFNHLFKYENEKALYSSISTEFINHHGVLSEYYVVTFDTDYDPLFGEDNDRRTERKFQFMTIFELPEEEEEWSFYDIAGLDTFSMFLTKMHWSIRSGMKTPRVGDFVATKYNRDMLYEITAVYDGEIDNRFLQKNHIWELVVKKWDDQNISDDADILPASSLEQDIFDVSDVVDQIKLSTDEVPDTYPETSGKGEPNPLYDPDPDEPPPNDPFGGF